MNKVSSVPNPFVGPRPFRRDDHLFGRTTELQNLCDLLTAERIVLLHSPSGAGKTSLINAGLIRALREDEGFRVLPVMRVNIWTGSTVVDASNKYVQSVFSYLEDGVKDENRISREELGKFTIGEYLKHRTRNPEDGPVDSKYEVLIFDQFEEIVTLDPTDQDAKREFFRQVGDALRDRNRWALFSMREDHLGEICEFSHFIPSAFAARFRLNLLHYTKADEAINRTTEIAGKPFGNTVVKKLVEDLATIAIGSDDTELVKGDFVEPVQLQVVCRRLWDQHVLMPLTFADVTGSGAVNDALEDFYVNAVENASIINKVPERVIRDWIEEHLVIMGSLRGQVARENKKQITLDLKNSVIDTLVNSHLIRAEPRRGIVWIEITHDRLVKPIVDNNARWRIESLTPFQQHAALWAKEHLDGMLLTGDALAEAESWISTQDSLEPEETEFLVACQKERDRLREIEIRNHEVRKANQELENRNKELVKEKANTRRWIIFGSIAVLLLILIVNQSRIEKQETLDQEIMSRQKARIQQLLSAARDLPDGQYTKALSLALIANKLANDKGQLGLDQYESELFSARVGLIGALSLSPPVTYRVLSGHKSSIRRLAFMPNGEILASASFDGTVRLWDINTGNLMSTLEHGNPVYSVAFSPDEKLMASGDSAGTIRLWLVEGGKIISALGKVERAYGHHGRVTSLDFSPDSSKLISGGGDHHVRVWEDLSNPNQPRLVARTKENGKPNERPTSAVYDVKFLTSDRVISGDWNGNIRFWEIPKSNLPPLTTELKPIESLSLVEKQNPLGKSVSKDSSVYGIAVNQNRDKIAASGLKIIDEKQFGQVETLWNRENNRWEIDPKLTEAIDPYSRPSPSSLGFSSNKENPAILIVRGRSKSAVIRDLDKNSPGRYPKSEYQFPERLYSLSAHPKDPDIFALGGMRTIYMINRSHTPVPFSTFLPIPEGEQPTNDVIGKWKTVSISEDGGTIAALDSGKLFIWKRSANSEWVVSRANLNLSSEPIRLAVNKDGRFVAIVHGDDKYLSVSIWGTESNNLITEKKLEELGEIPTKIKAQIAFTSNNHNDILAVTNSSKIGLYSLFTAEKPCHFKKTQSKGLGPNSPKLLCLLNEPQSIELDNGANTIRSIAFNSEGTLLATGASNSTITTWKVSSDRGLEINMPSFVFGDGEASALAFHPNGNQLAIGNNSGDVIIFNVNTFKIEDTLIPMHELPIQNIKFSGTAKQTILVSQDEEGSTYLWENSVNTYIPLRRMLLAGQKPLLAIDNSGEVFVTASGQTKNLEVLDLSQKNLFNQACAMSPAKLSKLDLERFNLTEDEANPCTKTIKTNTSH